MKIVIPLFKIISNLAVFLGAKSTTSIVKAINIIQPKNKKEWIILIIAIPVPFGVTAFLLYKLMRKNR